MLASHSSELIALVGLTWNAKSYDPGDRFQPKLLPHQRRTVDRMIHASSAKLGELSVGNMAIALERRPREAGVPAGFTLAGLLALHLVTDEQVQRFGWDEADTDETEDGGQQQQAAETPRPDWLDKDLDAEAVEDLWVVQAKTAGGPKRYDVLDAKGERVLTGGTIAGKANAVKKAKELIAARPPAEEREDDTLLGSSKLPAIVEVAGFQIQLGGIVAAAFEDFSAGREGVTDATAEWNDLPEDGEGGREERLQAMIDLFADDPREIAKRVPEANIVSATEVGADNEELDRLKAIAETDLDAMDPDGLRKWLGEQDMHGVEDATEEQLREAAGKIRTAAADQLTALESAPDTSEGAENGGDVQSDAGNAA